MDDQVDEFKARAARRNEGRAQLRRDGPVTAPSLGDSAEAYFLIIGVLYGGAAALFGVYCMSDTPQVGERLGRGDLEFATLRYFGGYWMYLFAPTVLFSIFFGVSRYGPTANAMRALGFSAALVSAVVFALIYFFGV